MKRLRSLFSAWLLIQALSATATAQELAPAPDQAAKRRAGTIRAVPGLRARARQVAQAAQAAPQPPTVPNTPPEPDPPGAAGPLPTNMDKIAQATDVPFRAKPGGHQVKFNLQDADLAELVNHISGLTGRRFIYGAKVRQIKATVVSPEPVSLEEAYQAFLSILEANGMTVVPHGRFMKIVDSGGVVGQATPIYARGEPVPDSDRYITRLYRLENVNPDEVVAILNKFKSKEADISVHTPGKLLIITDTATQIRRLIRIIEEVDVGGAGQHMWIEGVRNGSAVEMAKRINELFELGGQPGQAPSARAGGLSRVLADDASNSLIVVGSNDGYLRLLEVLRRLDTRSTDGGRVHVLPLQHAIAEELAATLTQMLGATAARNQPATGGTAGGMFEGEVRVTADKSTNSLVITSSNRDYATLRLVVDELDQARRQVFIEAVVMDLAVSDRTTLGIAYHGGTTLGGGADQPLFLGGFRAETSLAFPVPTQSDPTLLQGLAAGLRGAPLGGESNLLGTGLSIPAFGVVLNALASSGKSNVLATPHIIATDNVPAEINIGDNIPLQTNVGGSALSSLAGAGAGQNINPLLLAGLGGGLSAQRQDVGTKIKVTPHVNKSNQVRLELQLESSSAGAPIGQLGAVPIQQRTTNTTTVVQDQQTVVIGGLMRDEYVTSREKIPVLGDLPLLGALFRRTETTKRKANLLLILTPHVIRDQADLRRIFERKMQERQEFLDRYFVFGAQDWRPPRDWTRTSGLVEDIRKAYREVQEHLDLEAESRGLSEEERVPSPPIALPGELRAGEAAPGAPLPARRTRRTRVQGSAQPTPAPATPVPAPPNPPPTAPQAPQPEGSNPGPFRISPIARSVQVLRTE